nr:ABC transporter ATP-binding protein [Lachnospiraceae bacterium]
MAQAITVKDLVHSYGGKQVLRKISIEAGEGQIIGMLGPSGAGKTTLISILTGQLMPTGGICQVFGKDCRHMNGEDYQKLGIMMDSFGLYERMNCFDNLKFYQMLDGKNTDDIDPVLAQVGLSEAKKTLACDLSKGMRNRLAFARAILRRPQLLFLDEPTSGLDPMTTEAIHEMILAQKKKGATVFLTTHNMYEAQKLCDHIVLLNEGEIVESGSPQEICRRYNHQKKIRLHLVSGEDVQLQHDAKAGEKIAAYLASGTLETIHSTEPNLETVFMELTGKGLDK